MTLTIGKRLPALLDRILAVPPPPRRWHRGRGGGRACSSAWANEARCTPARSTICWSSARPAPAKTTSIVIPTLAFHHGPAVATSTKHDLFDVTAWRRSHLGQCWLWARPIPPPTRPGSSRSAGHPSRAAPVNTTPRPGTGFERAQALVAPLLHAAAAGGDLAVVLSWLHRRELSTRRQHLTTHQSPNPGRFTDFKDLTKDQNGCRSSTISTKIPSSVFGPALTSPAFCSR
jgi:hypothetical protein